MTVVLSQVKLDLPLEELISTEELAQLMGIYEESARELLNGTIPFELDEISQITSHWGINLSPTNFSMLVMGSVADSFA